MKLSIQPASGDGAIREQPNQLRAFTLVESAVVVAMVAVLATLVLPAMAGVQHKSGRAQCANNLRQIGAASMIYAGEYGGWLPIWVDGTAHPRNVINALSYTAYVVLSAPTTGLVPTNIPSSQNGWEFENLGYLYDYGLAGNGQMLFCPAQSGKGNTVAPNYYFPLLSTDQGTSGPPRVRSSYNFNPRAFTSSNLRRFQETSDLEPRKLLAGDYTNPQVWAHTRERGWNLLMTDSSVSFSQNNKAFLLMSLLNVTASPFNLEPIWDLMEQDH